MAKTYRKIATIQAIQFTGGNWDEIAKFTDGRVFKDFSSNQIVIGSGAEPAFYFENQTVKYFIHTLEGNLEFTPGCWIASGGNDDFWAIQDAIFVKTYEEVQ